MQKQKKKRIGIIGGSYNPVHIAHLIIADRFAEQMKLDQVFLIPAYRSPFKLEEEGTEFATAEHRIAMLRLAVEYYPQFEISTIETEREGVSYTIDTVRYFRELYPEAELFMLIGSDQATAFTRWKDWVEIVRQVHLCIARRPHTISPEVEHVLSFTLSNEKGEPHWIDAPLMAFSSTDIRNRMESGRSIKFVVPWKVEQYIYENRLYMREKKNK